MKQSKAVINLFFTNDHPKALCIPMVLVLLLQFRASGAALFQLHCNSNTFTKANPRLLSMILPYGTCKRKDVSARVFVSATLVHVSLFNLPFMCFHFDLLPYNCVHTSPIWILFSELIPSWQTAPSGRKHKAFILHHLSSCAVLCFWPQVSFVLVSTSYWCLSQFAAFCSMDQNKLLFFFFFLKKLFNPSKRVSVLISKQISSTKPLKPAKHQQNNISILHKNVHSVS